MTIRADELIVDNFAGGGGASTGIELALGRSPDIAVNHDPDAVAMHAANHPRTMHLCGDVWDVDPKAVCRGRPVGLLWASPDCKHFSKAKGGKPVEKKIRSLAWVVVRWAKTVRPRVILLENVEEFQDWGPLTEDNLPDKARRGLTFRRWVGALKSAGYVVEAKQLRAWDYGAPTVRKRLFIIARCDGQPIIWPEPTHGRGLLPYRTAAECIDWTIPCPSIFGRSKPLAEKTLARIARGIYRFVLGNARPFIVPMTHDGDAHQPLGTVVCDQKHALVAAFLAKHYGGHEATGSRLSDPVSTVTAQDHHSLVAAHLLKMRGTCMDGQTVEKPMPTVTAGGWHLAEVRSFLIRYNGVGLGQQLNLPMGTATAKARFGLVTVHGEDYQIVDIGLRMLQPRELFRAQGFPERYQIDRDQYGEPITKTAQIRLCGNSVSPEVARALVAANFRPADEAAA